MKKYFLIFTAVLALFIVILIPIALGFMVLDHTPVVYDTVMPNVEHASKLKALAKKAVKKILGKEETAVLNVFEKELNGFMVFAARSIKRFSGYVSIEDKGMLILSSVKVPDNPAGRYLNLKIYLSPSNNGIKIHKVYLGRLFIPGSAAYRVIEILLNVILGNHQGSKILNAVNSVAFQDKAVSVNFRPLPDLETRLTPLIKNLKNVRDLINPVCNPSVVSIYYSTLIEVEQKIPPGTKVSLARFLGPLFELAAIRSRSAPPEDENRAAILALCVFAGDWWFEQVTGKLNNYAGKKRRPRFLKIVLSGRKDLRLHFVISAGLKVVSDSNMSFAAGEFKELLDAVSGGSGFSFVDLAADRAGVKFAQIATNPKWGARRIQTVMSGHVQENLFFPDISALPEGIHQKQFEKYFKNVESDSYKSLVRDIDNHLSCLPAYVGQPTVIENQ